LAAFGEADGRLHVFDLKTSSHWRVTPPSPPRVLRFRPAAREVAMSGWGSLAVEMVDVESGHSTNSIHVAGSAPALAWSDDGKRLAVACPDRKVRVWEMGLSAPPRELEGHQAVPTQLAFSVQGRWLASSGPDSTVRLWDPTRHGKPLVTFPDAVEVRQLHFSSDGRLAGNVSGSLQWWDIEAGAEYSSFFEPQARRMNCLDVDPSSRFLAAAHEGGMAFWELDSSVRPVSLGQSDAKSPRFNPVTGELFFADIEGVWRVRVVRPATNSSDALRVGARELLMRSALVSALDCAADGKSLAVMWEDRVEVFDAGNLVTLLAVRVERGLTGVALSPDGRRLAATHGRKGEVWVWDLPGDRRPPAAAPNADAPRTVLRAPGGGPVVFSPSGDQLAVGTETACQIWNGPAWQPEESIRRMRPSRRPAVVSFSPDATLLAFTTEDARVQLVEAATHEPLAQLESPRKEPLVCLRFTPDGVRLVGTTTGGSIDVWNLAQLRAGLARLNLDFPWPPFPGKKGTASLPRGAALPDGTTSTDSPIRGPRDAEPLR
jgi:WD40 repeat protein